MRLAGLERIPKSSKKTCCFLDRLGCQKGSFLEPFWEGKSVQNGDLTKLDVKKVNFQKSVFSLGGSTILKDKHAWKSNKNGSTALLRGNFFALNFRSRILIDLGSVSVQFRPPKWSQVRSKKFKKFRKMQKMHDQQRTSSQRWSKTPLKVVLGRPRGHSERVLGWPGGVWGGPGGHFGRILGSKNRCQQRISNSEHQRATKRSWSSREE